MLFKRLLSDMHTLVPESLPGVRHSPSPHPERPFPCLFILERPQTLHPTLELHSWLLEPVLLLPIWGQPQNPGRYCRDLFKHTRWWPPCPSGPVSQFGSCDSETRRELPLLLCSMRRHSCQQPTDFPSILAGFWRLGVLLTDSALCLKICKRYRSLSCRTSFKGRLLQMIRIPTLLFLR